MRRIRRAWALLVVATACGGTDPFVCTDDASCSGGTCQPSGYCSFDDPDCASGQRYGSHAPAHLAGTCVDLGNADTPGETSVTDSDPSTSLTTTSSAMTTNASTPTDPSSEVSSSAMTTFSESSVTGDPTEGTTSVALESSSDETAPPVEVCRVEEFDDEVLDDWVLVQGGPTEAFVDEDLLIVDLSPNPSSAGIDPIVYGIPDGSIEVELLEAPNQVIGTQVYLGIGNEDESFLVLLEDGLVTLRHDLGEDGYENLLEVPWGADVLWWRIEIEGGELTFLVSDDGVGWEPLDSVVPGFDLEEAQSYLRAGTWVEPPAPPGFALFERVTVCTFE